MKTYYITFAHTDTQLSADTISTAEKVTGSKFTRINGCRYTFNHKGFDTNDLIILKLSISHKIESLKEVKKTESVFENDFNVVANIC